VGDHSWLYEFSKDFAGPIVTLAAAAAALVFTIVFQIRQAQLSKNSLRLGLFEKRYAKMIDAKKLIETIANTPDDRVNPGVVRNFYISIDEGRFLLSPATNAFLGLLHDRCEAYLNALTQRKNVSLDDSDEWAKSADDLARKMQAIRDMYAQIPEQFERDLKIEAA